eukprot:scaffold25307_cov109-Isochrysis_galbana.AAC.10
MAEEPVVLAGLFVRVQDHHVLRTVHPIQGDAIDRALALKRECQCRIKGAHRVPKRGGVVVRSELVPRDDGLGCSGSAAALRFQAWQDRAQIFTLACRRTVRGLVRIHFKEAASGDVRLGAEAEEADGSKAAYTEKRKRLRQLCAGGRRVNAATRHNREQVAAPYLLDDVIAKVGRLCVPQVRGPAANILRRYSVAYCLNEHSAYASRVGRWAQPLIAVDSDAARDAAGCGDHHVRTDRGRKFGSVRRHIDRGVAHRGSNLGEAAPTGVSGRGCIVDRDIDRAGHLRDPAELLLGVRRHPLNHQLWRQDGRCRRVEGASARTGGVLEKQR